MAEVELKFQVGPMQLAGVQRALVTPSARGLGLHALYFDTADRRLAAAGLALRLRREGRRWVQTLKGAGHPVRSEHEVALRAQRGVPALDVQRHAECDAGQALLALLRPDAAALAPVFEVEVRRTLRVVHSGGARIELALDIGQIRAGDARLPLCELEFELLSGPLEALVALASRWCLRHGLWLDVRSKSERGHRLALGVAAGTPVMARAVALHAQMSPDAALREIVAACLAQILPNLADIAGGLGQPEHLHQARVGLRRLRSALKLYGGWSADVDAAWPGALAALFRRLGGARDRDALQAGLLPQLQAAGAPTLALPVGDDGDDPAALLRAPPSSALMLALLAFAHGQAPPADGAAPRLPQVLRPVLDKALRQLRRDAAAFAGQDDAQRHRTRRRVKRLRYGVDFVAALFPGKALRRYLQPLLKAQDALGKYADLVLAQALFGAQLADDARAWFALGWLAARRERLQARAARALARLARARRFW